VINISIVYDSNFKGQTEVLANSIASGINSIKNASGHLVHVDKVGKFGRCCTVRKR